MNKAFAGIDLGGTAIKAGILLETGERITSIKMPSGAKSGPEQVGINLSEAVDQLLSISENKGLKIYGIGIGSPGTIHYPEGIVTGSSPNIPGWIGVNFRKMFANRDIEVRGDNDANCMALGEHKFGAGKGTKSGFYITVGTGIGGALILDGRLIRGSSFAAGEFGHTVLKYNGRKCKCGRRGCVEAYAAVPALVRNTKSLIRKKHRSTLKNELDNLSPQMIFQAFKKGDKIASKAIHSNAAMLGTSIGSVVNLFNPEIVVIGGGFANAGPDYIDLIRKKVFDFAFSSAAEKLVVKAARLGNNAGWIGAACLFLD